MSLNADDAAFSAAGSSEGRWPRICERAAREPLRIAMLSLHTSPLAAPGRARDAGGMNVYIRELARHLAPYDVAVDVFTRWTDPHLPQIVPLGAEARLIHIPAGPIAPLAKTALFAVIPQFINGVECFAISERTDYHLIHSHYWLSGVAGMYLAHRWHAPHLVMFHTLARLKQHARPAEEEPPLRIEQERHIIANADGIIVATEDERQQIARLYRVPAHEIVTIPCGVDLERFSPQGRKVNHASLARRLQIPIDAPLLLFVGRLDPLKGPDLLIESLALLRADAHLVILGGDATDPERSRLAALAHTLGIAERVHLLDAVSQERLPDFYRAADLLMIGSHYESFGLVAVEALACGTPVVAPRVGGLPVIVHDGENGVLVGHRSPVAFAGRIDALLADRDRYRRLASAARASVTGFSWHAIAAQVAGQYRASLERIPPLALAR